LGYRAKLGAMTELADPVVKSADLRRLLLNAAMIAFVLLLGLGGTALIYRALQANVALQQQNRFKAAAQSVLDALDLDMTRTVEAVRSAAIMAGSQQTVSRREFVAYGSRVIAPFGKLSQLQWEPVVPSNLRAQAESQAQKNGLAHYRIFEIDSGQAVPASERDQYVPILFSIPERIGTVGFDLASDPARMGSRLKARDSGQAFASETFAATIAGANDTASLVFSISAPVYEFDRPASLLSSISDRRNYFQGYVSGQVQVDLLLKEAALRAASGHLNLVVTDLGTATETTIFDTGDPTGAAPAPTILQPTELEHAWRKTVTMANRPWEIRLSPQPSFYEGDAEYNRLIVLAGGVGATVLLALTILLMQRRQSLMRAAQASQLSAERALKVERQRLHNIIEGTGAGTWELNLQTRELHVNERFFAMLGYKPGEIVPFDFDTWQALGHPDEIVPLHDYLKRLASGKTDAIDAETRRLHKSGQYVWVLVKGRVFAYAADGSPLWMAGIMQDISARKQAQDQIIELNNTLELRVQERSAELQAAMATLHRSQEELARSEANATLSTLVASVSHELSTPMGNSLMAASTLVDQSTLFQQAVDGNQLKRSDLASFVRTMREGCDLMLSNLQRAVELLKNFRQVVNDQASEQRRCFDLASAVREVVATLAPSLKKSPHRVVVNIPEGIDMDSFPGPLGQVVINLVNNAYLHAFDGLNDGVVTIEATLDAERVRMTVSDNGSGMSPQTQAHLFQPFFSTKAGRGGTGLGMTIVENLVTKTLGGSLSVHSVAGQGTTLTIEVPVSAPHSET
jgi:PAS domain S-box-containing protein